MAFIRNFFISIVIAIVAITFYPGLEPEIDFTAFEVTPARPLEGKLALNERLNNAEKLFVDEIHSPECVVKHKNELYMGVQGGHILKLSNGKLLPVAKIGQTCYGFQYGKVCGRPLGLKFDRAGSLYAADAFNGIFKINVTSGQTEQLISLDVEIDGVKPLVPNSLAVASDGMIYWSDSSTHYNLYDGVFDCLTSGSGRLIQYNPKTKQNKVLIPNVHFANGVELSADESFVVVAETMRNRVRRYHLRGPKQGTSDVFIDGLPGMPDNVKRDSKGNFLVSIVVAVDEYTPQILQIIGPFPNIRKFVARLLHLVEKIPSEQVRHVVGHFDSVSFVRPDRYSLLIISHQGEIVDALHSIDGSLKGSSDVEELNGAYYFGSYSAKHLAKVPLSKTKA
uniref:Adipocyte plasma membrane-associated protein n=1 Tax=Cacopsylla melanoneura TaxID=428564 RepID=A0A8D8TQJ2_9HEMI